MMKNCKLFIYYVMFVAVFSGCSEEDDVTSETDQPVAAFGFEVDEEDPLTVHFTNSSENATAYIWDFGDNSGSSTDKEPSYTYSSAGEYTVSLTATGEGGTNETTHSVKVAAAGGGPGGSGEPTECLLTMITATYTDDFHTDTDDISFVYDDEGNLTKLQFTDADGDVEALELIYADGRLEQVKYFEGDEYVDSYLIEYDGDKLSKVSASYEDNGETYTFEYRFIYAEDRVSNVEYWTNEYVDINEEVYVGDLYRDEDTEFTYENGNIVKSVEKDFSEDGVLETKDVVEFTYDDKINPYQGNLPWLLWDEDWEKYFNNNNPTSRTYTSEDYDEEGNVKDTFSQVREYSYDYNENDLPVKITDSTEGEAYSDEYTLGYECN